MSKTKYPECEKMNAVSEDSNKIGAFLDWLNNEQCVVLARYYDDVECENCEETSKQLLPIRLSIEELLAEYFDIDLDKVEKERREILERLSDNNE